MTGPSTRRQVAKAAGSVGSLTFLSRILGYLRDMVVASFFGAGIYADAFIAAFRIPNLMRRLFGEGSLSVAFVPVFSQYIVRSGNDEANKLAGSAVRMLMLVLTIVVLLGIIFAPLIVNFVAPGFDRIPQKMTVAVGLTRVMFPYLFFIGLVALSMAILNTLGHFAAPALAPAILNVAMIGALLIASFFSPLKKIQVFALAIGVLVGGMFQLGAQLPLLKRSGIGFHWRGPLIHPGLKKVGRLMLPTIFGSAVYQINILVGTLLASKLPEGSISYLYYSDRLVQFPLGIFAVAIGTAVLPALSRQAAGGDYAGLKETFAEAVSLIFFIMLPAMVGLAVLREPIITVLFQRGAFSAQDSQLTADALLYYCSGLWAFAAVRVLLPTFYALQNSWIPVKSAVISIGANLILSIVLMKPMGHCGLAFATSLASMLNFVLLTLSLRFRLGAIGWAAIMGCLAKSLGCSMIMGGIVWGMYQYCWVGAQDHRILLLLNLAVTIIIGAAFYVLFANALHLPQIKTIMYIIKKDKKSE